MRFLSTSSFTCFYSIATVITVVAGYKPLPATYVVLNGDPKGMLALTVKEDNSTTITKFTGASNQKFDVRNDQAQTWQTIGNGGLKAQIDGRGYIYFSDADGKFNSWNITSSDLLPPVYSIQPGSFELFWAFGKEGDHVYLSDRKDGVPGQSSSWHFVLTTSLDGLKPDITPI